MKYILDAGRLQATLAYLEPEERGPAMMQASIELMQGIEQYWAKKEPKPKSKAALGEYSEAFEEFWEAYPKKVSKGGAYACWKKLIGKDKDAEHTLASFCCLAIGWQKDTQQWKNENGKYIPNPETYLNNRKWEDEPPTQSKRETYMDHNGVMRER